jgi:bile acid-coenzyme A ligase
MGRAVTMLAQARPDAPALTDDAGVLTRSELDRRTNRLARAFQERGVRRGDFVTIAMPNGRGFLEAAIASWKLGAVPQPLSHRLPPAERDEIIALAKPALVAGAQGSDRSCEGVPATYEPPPSLSDGALPDIIAPHWRAPTSGGSTGRPKLIVSGAPGAVDLEAPPPYNLRRDGVQVVAGPLFHTAFFTLALQGLLAGNHVVVMSAFDARQTLLLVDRHGADFLLLVPSMMHEIWRVASPARVASQLASLQTLWHMSAPCPTWLKATWIDWLGAHRVFESYSGSERQAATRITGEEWLLHPGSVGRVVLGEMRVLDEDGAECPRGRVGEIFMRRPVGSPPTYHYVGAVPRARGDWDSLGDMGHMDPDGYVYLADRRADVIEIRGIKVFPAHIEGCLEEHPAIRSCAAISLPSPDRPDGDEQIHAIVQLDGEVTDAELTDFLARRLAPHELPASYERVTESLRDEAGKSRRSALRASRLSVAR